MIDHYCRNFLKLLLLIGTLLLIQCTGQSVTSVRPDSNNIANDIGNTNNSVDTNTSGDTNNSNTNKPLATSYNHNLILGQAIKDEVLANDAVVIKITNLPSTTLTWTAGSTSETVAVTQGEIKLTKGLLTNLNSLSDGAVLSINIYEDKTLIHSARFTYKPLEVWGWEDLQAMRKNISAHYTLETSIVFPEAQKLEPISGLFTGRLNGKGHTISHLLIEGKYSLSGLFEHLKGAEVSNIVFVHPRMDITYTGISSLASGIVAGAASNSSTIEKIAVRGNGRMIIRDSLIGGPAGMLVGILTDSTLKNSYVLSSHIYKNVNYAALQLIRTVAGIVGTNHESSMLNIYWAGKIFSNINAAEKVNPTTYSDYQSQAQYYSQLDPIIAYVATLESYTFENIYWDNDITQTDLTKATLSNTHAASKTTAEMKQQSTYENWDFMNIWDIDPTVNDGYPFLRGQLK